MTARHRTKATLATAATATAVALLAPAAEAKGSLKAVACGASACRPIFGEEAARLVPWYGVRLRSPDPQAFYVVELRMQIRGALGWRHRVVWAPRADMVWSDLPEAAAAGWRHADPGLRRALRHATRRLSPFPASPTWRAPRRTRPVTVVKVCGAAGRCRGVGQAGAAGHLARARLDQASRVEPPSGPWFRVVVRQRGRDEFVWSLRYAPKEQAILIDRKDPAPPFWVPAPKPLVRLLVRAARGIEPHPAQP